MTRKTSTRPALDDDAAVAARVDAVARAVGVPSLAPAPPLGAGGGGDMVNLRIAIPDRLNRHLGVKAAETRVTKRFLVLEALKAAGYPVDDADLVEDGRALRGARAR